MSVDALVRETAAELNSPGVDLFAEDAKPARFTLFHAANSICSQKVRAVLAYHHVAHVAYIMDMSRGQTYLPSYVRLRMIGCERLGTVLMNAHTGSTSVTAGGCDAAVVPALVDWHTDDVIVDSKRICIYIDALFPDAARLYPTALTDAIDEELSVVDNLPNYQMLNGRPPGEDRRPVACRGNDGTNIARMKVARLDEYLQRFADDATLTAAYTAKRSKELEGGGRLFTPEAMQAAYAKAQNACEALDAKLAAAGTPWLFGASPTMADLFWAVELLRMENLGVGWVWEAGRLSAVERFVAAAHALPAIRSAITDWPKALY